MKYRVMLDLAFDDERDTREVFEVAKRLSKKVKCLNIDEGMRINIHRCFHDETPFKPCEVIEEVVVVEGAERREL